MPEKLKLPTDSTLHTGERAKALNDEMHADYAAAKQRDEQPAWRPEFDAAMAAVAEPQKLASDDATRKIDRLIVGSTVEFSKRPLGSWLSEREPYRVESNDGETA